MMDPLWLYKSPDGYKAIMAWYDSLVESFDFDFDEKRLPTRFGDTHCLTAGDPKKEAVFLLQGVAGSAPLWRHQIPALAEHFYIYALDTPGQPGKSASTPLSFLDGSYTDWLADCLDAAGREKAHLVGNSAGGWIAMKMAAAHPERVISLGLLSPTGLKRARLPVNIWLKNVIRKKRDVNALEDNLTTRSFAPGRKTREYDRQLARAMALATRHFRLDWSLDLLDDNRKKISMRKGLATLRIFFGAMRRKELASVRCPALLILGEHEMLYHSAKAARRARKFIPHLVTEIIPNVGHSAMFDDPETVNRLLIEFMKNREP